MELQFITTTTTPPTHQYSGGDKLVNQMKRFFSCSPLQHHLVMKYPCLMDCYAPNWTVNDVALVPSPVLRCHAILAFTVSISYSPSLSLQESKTNSSCIPPHLHCHHFAVHHLHSLPPWGHFLATPPSNILVGYRGRSSRSCRIIVGGGTNNIATGGWFVSLTLHFVAHSPALPLDLSQSVLMGCCYTPARMVCQPHYSLVLRGTGGGGGWWLTIKMIPRKYFITLVTTLKIAFGT